MRYFNISPFVLVVVCFLIGFDSRMGSEKCVCNVVVLCSLIVMLSFELPE